MLLLIGFVLAAIYIDNILKFSKYGLNVWNIIVSTLLLIFGLLCVGWYVIHFFKVKETPMFIPRLRNVLNFKE
jgi:hypothetical protein